MGFCSSVTVPPPGHGPRVVTLRIRRGVAFGKGCRGFLTRAVYEDEQKRRFLAVEGEHEPEIPTSPDAPEKKQYWLFQGRRAQISDLLDHGLVEPGERLVWDRPQLGDHYEATIEENGAIRLEDGRVASSPSRAAVLAAGIVAAGGWGVWKVERLGVTLGGLRDRLISGETDPTATR